MQKGCLGLGGGGGNHKKKEVSKVGTNSTLQPLTLDDNLAFNVSVDVEATRADIDRNVMKEPLNSGTILIEPILYAKIINELKDTIAVAVPKLVGEGFSMCTILIEYERKPPRCSSCKVFGHVLDECHKKIVSDVLKNLKNPRQAVRRVLVGPKLWFKPTKQVYQHVSKKNTVSASGKNQQAGLTRQELVEKGVNSDVVSSAHGISSEVFVDEVFNEIVRFMASTSYKVNNNSKSGSGVGNKRIYEQWREDYIEYPYDDDEFDDYALTDA
ncbi:hypothetical protein Tco_1285379 [Tanacetum coccineum]